MRGLCRWHWAGRRLFLVDGSPDPATPGAYRYQTRPDLCDLAAPDSDPASPRYEPPHLRHKPGDTWEIGGKPRDPDDPGAFGSPGWRPDSRTGRHRRGELPDPIPPCAPDRPSAGPRRRPRFWQEESRDERVDGKVAQEEPYQFGKLREDAWDRFVVKSSELAAAHWVDRRALDCQHRLVVGVILRLTRWVVAVVQGRRENEAPALGSALPRQSRTPPGRGQQSVRPIPGAQLAQAIRGAQAARAPRDEAAREGARVAQARGVAHGRGRPRQERPRPSPLPYMARWEQAFDAHRAFGEVATL